jgi:outer membrane lipoprotein carrier protein
MPLNSHFFVFFNKKNNKIFLQVNKLFRANKIRLGLTIVFLFLSQAAFAQELPPVGDIVRKMQTAYEKTKDFKADFVQETTIKSVKKTQTEEGSVFFKTPKNMLWDYTKPEPKKMIINSQKAWLYLPREKVVYTQNSESILQSKVLINFFSGAGKLQDDFSIKYAEPKALDNNRNYLLVLTPRKAESGFNVLKVKVDKNKFNILQLSFDDVMGNTTTLKFSNISINTGLTQKKFQFKPPAGVEVFEMP